jgi:hypothetical protein
MIAGGNMVNGEKFRYNTVKNLQISGARAKITVEVDLAGVVKSLRYDVNPYGITRERLSYGYLAKAIARQLDWQAYALSTNDDHELARLCAYRDEN